MFENGSETYLSWEQGSNGCKILTRCLLDEPFPQLLLQASFVPYQSLNNTSEERGPKICKNCKRDGERVQNFFEEIPASARTDPLHFLSAMGSGRSALDLGVTFYKKRLLAVLSFIHFSLFKAKTNA